VKQITEPGLYLEYNVNDYHRDPCPAPSLTQSIAKILAGPDDERTSPHHAWAAHPRLNPNWVPNEDTKFNIGNCAHAILLGRGRQIVIAPFENWRKDAARAMRDEAEAVGKMCVLAEQYERAGKMANVALDRLAQYEDGAGRPLVSDWNKDRGAAEVMAAWSEGDVWFRQLIDWLPAHGQAVYDYKTTKAKAAPHRVPAKMANDGWAIQAAMLERGLNMFDPVNAGRRKYRFVCQEVTFPYELTVTEVPESAMTIGRAQLEEALELWRACMAIGTHEAAWPGYGVEILRPEYPKWAEARWDEHKLQREVEREQMLEHDHLMGG
jgi:PDDEXK-like domain of unknown function (DUF3799)